MKNPWVDVPLSAPFVLPDDGPYVQAFNKICEIDGRPNHQLDLRFPPSPFLGLHDAPLVVLLGNPLTVPEALDEQLEPSFLKRTIDGITTDGGTPFWPLLDECVETRSAKWWRPRVTDLVNIVGSYEALSKKLMSVDLHGYFALNWSAPFANFPSQAYGFSLVRDAIEREATIIVARCWREWYAAVPELVNYKKQIPQLDSQRSVYLSRANMDGVEGGFGLIEEALRK